MSQQTLPCTPHPQNNRGWVHFFSHRCLRATKFFSPKKKWISLEILRDKAQKTCFCAFLLKLDFHQLSPRPTSYTFKLYKTKVLIEEHILQ